MDLPVKNIVSEIDLKPGDALLPLFESITNAIHSLKLTSDVAKAKKKIQVQLFRGEYPDILIPKDKLISSIKVIDNGEGFTNTNVKSFKTAYSRKNKELGCKGIGRFTMLAAYRKIVVQSTYKEENEWMYREIQFDAENEVQIVKEEKTAFNERKTIVELSDCYNDTIHENTAKSVEEIAEAIMQHCLVYYLCNELPLIEVLDKDSQQIAVVNEMYKSLSKEREKDFKVGNEKFRYYITKSPKINNRKNHYVHYCANSRVVGTGRSIAKVNSLFAYPLIENGVAQFLDVYVVSDYLNKKVYAARNGFTIPQERENDLFGAITGELVFDDIETVLAKQMEAEYDDFIKETQNRNIREIKEYISKSAPRYKRFLKREEVLDSIPANLSDDKKEEHLYKISFNEGKVISNKIQKFIDNKDINENTIQEVKQELIDKTAFDADCLSDYMFRRKAIIDIFKKFLEADVKGQYRLEKDIHNLIFPMGMTLDNIDYESHNLWLLDERFALYNFIASDVPITNISQKNSQKEPDIIMTNAPKMFDNPISFAANASGAISSMVIFEFKRPGQTAHQKPQSNYRWEFSELIEKYFDDFLYADNKKNYKGRQVILQPDTPKFGYVIVDVIPPKLQEYNITKGFKKTPFGTLYKINPELNLHIEVITFEQLLDAVEKRHAPFFDKLFNN
jgi:Histidine kinase-, DNA gyrase B-, and HSP90-like ATPase